MRCITQTPSKRKSISLSFLWKNDDTHFVQTLNVFILLSEHVLSVKGTLTSARVIQFFLPPFTKGGMGGFSGVLWAQIPPQRGLDRQIRMG